jgi:hypothetical protein
MARLGWEVGLEPSDAVGAAEVAGEGDPSDEGVGVAAGVLHDATKTAMASRADRARIVTSRDACSELNQVRQ